MNDARDTTNPYQADFVSSTTPTTTPISPVMPGFVKAMLIVGIVFAILRLITVPLSVVGLLSMSSQPNPPPMVATVPFEIITSAGVAVFGLATCILLLLRRKLGVTMACVLSVFVLGSLAVAVWQGVVSVGQFPMGSPEAYSILAVVSIVGILRIAWLITFFIGVVRCKRWLEAGNAV